MDQVGVFYLFALGLRGFSIFFETVHSFDGANVILYFRSFVFSAELFTYYLWDMEVWKEVKWNTSYEVSNLGNVRSKNRRVINHPSGSSRIAKGKMLKLTVFNNGYQTVSIGKGKKITVHRLVALHFISNPKKLPVIDHIDGNRLNNKDSNLQWTTLSENMKMAYRNGQIKKKGSNHHLNKLNEVDVIEMRRLYKNGFSQQYLKNKFKISLPTISGIVNRKSWTHI